MNLGGGGLCGKRKGDGVAPWVRFGVGEAAADVFRFGLGVGVPFGGVAIDGRFGLMLGVVTRESTGLLSGSLKDLEVAMLQRRIAL